MAPSGSRSSLKWLAVGALVGAPLLALACGGSDSGASGPAGGTGGTQGGASGSTQGGSAGTQGGGSGGVQGGGSGGGVDHGVAGCPLCEVMFDGVGKPFALAADDKGVFFVSQAPSAGVSFAGTLRTLDAGGKATEVAEVGQCEGMALTEDSIYLAGVYQGSSGLLKFSRSNLASPPALMAKLAGTSAVAIADGFVYFGRGDVSGTGGGQLLRCPLEGCAADPEVVVEAYPAGLPRRLAAGAGAVLLFAYSPQAKLFLVDLTQATKTASQLELYANGGEAFFVSGTSGYFIEPQSQPALVRCALPGCTTKEPAASIGQPFAIAADGDDLYYNAGRAIQHTTLDKTKCTSDSCVDILMSGLATEGPYSDNAQFIAVDKTYVYWFSGEETVGTTDNPEQYHHTGVLMRQPR